jgi:flagellar motor switch protein FliM
LQRYRKTLQIKEVIKTEKDQVKEVLEMLEGQRKNRIANIAEEGE